MSPSVRLIVTHPNRKIGLEFGLLKDRNTNIKTDNMILLTEYTDCWQLCKRNLRVYPGRNCQSCLDCSAIYRLL